MNTYIQWQYVIITLKFNIFLPEKLFLASRTEHPRSQKTFVKPAAISQTFCKPFNCDFFSQNWINKTLIETIMHAISTRIHKIKVWVQLFFNFDTKISW